MFYPKDEFNLTNNPTLLRKFKIHFDIRDRTDFPNQFSIELLQINTNFTYVKNHSDRPVVLLTNETTGNINEFSDSTSTDVTILINK